MALFANLNRYPYNGTEMIPCYQPGQVEDGFIVPGDLINSPVLVTTTSSVAYQFSALNLGVVTEYLGTNSSVFTIAADATYNAPTGSLLQVEVLGTAGVAGRITFQADPGVTIRWPKAADGTTDCRISRAINSVASFRKRGPNDWFGGASDLTAT